MKQYDIFELSKDLNPKIPKGEKGVVLEVFNENAFLVEFVNDNGTNVEFNGQSTFTIDNSFIQPKP